MTIQNFRNLSNVNFNPCETVNVIYGDNAQGKTNLLEALWLFTGAKSFRQAKEAELPQFGSASCALQMAFFGEERNQTAELRFGQNKKCMLNGIEQESAARLAGCFLGVVFSPTHLSLIKEGPGLRRRFLDTAIGQLTPKYINWLTQHNRILQQRGALLRDVARHPALIDTLEVWDAHLVNIGAAIWEARLRYVERLKKNTQEIYKGISSGKEVFSLDYKSSTGAQGLAEKRIVLEKMLMDALTGSRSIDLAQGITSTGVHRDDLRFFVDQKEMRAYGSQGQQRSAVLALKLAECGILKEITGEEPIVLLDDVMSELDKGRRNFLLNHINGRQVFLTCCEKELFSSLQEGQCFPIQTIRRLPPDG